MRGGELFTWLMSLPTDRRDEAVDRLLGIEALTPSSAPPGEHLVGYHASGVAPILEALAAVPVVGDDVVVDLGAGLGRVLLLAHLLTGARGLGVEIQPALAAEASRVVRRLEADVTIVCADARTAALDAGTVFFLYAPFTGPALDEVLRRLRAVAERHAIVVCALGIDLRAPWLIARPVDSFWLAVYDSVVPGVAPRAARPSLLAVLTMPVG